MEPERAHKPWRPFGLFLFIAAAAALWWAFDRLEPHANWLQAEAPVHAVAGQPFPLRVRLAPLTEPAFLCADLHWSTTRETSRGYLATAGPRQVGKEGGSFGFEIMVRPTNGLRFVTGIIFLSRTGDWPDHTHVAATEPIPVNSGRAENSDTRLAQLRLQSLDEDWSGDLHPSAIPRVLIALLFFAATVMAWRGSRSLAGSERGQQHQKWRALTVALALACLWESAGLERWLGAQARGLARAWDFYYLRSGFQKVMTSLALASTGGLLVIVSRARKSSRLLLAAFGLYLGISAESFLSLHVVDQIAGLSWHSLTLLQTLKLACAALVLQGAINAKSQRGKGAKDFSVLPQS